MATAVGPVVEMGVETVAGMGAGMVAGSRLFMFFVLVFSFQNRIVRLRKVGFCEVMNVEVRLTKREHNSHD